MSDKNNTAAIAATHGRMERRMRSTTQTHPATNCMLSGSN